MGGVKFRVPRVLPTSNRFLDLFASRQRHPPVKWIFRMPGSKRCRQVNYVIHRAEGVPDEAEWLFAVYSVFVVRAVRWSADPQEKCHEIELDVIEDNALESDNLPVAPWC